MSEMFDLIDKNIQYYCDSHTSEESKVLYELYRETHLKTVYPRMISAKSQGAFLQMISRMIQPKRILELGTFTGYATIALAAGLTDDGWIATVEKNPELESIIRKYILKAGLKNKVHLLIGNALELIPALNETWDLIFIDADKINYLTYYNMLIPFLSDKGMMLVDNVLWSGKVIEAVKNNDKDTKAILAFNTFVQQDVRVRNMILPFRDGIMMIQKEYGIANDAEDVKISD
ncbi:MAG: O-methyltransferase [Bacteroidales bacterium]|jgi:predicted O-methyltransferase YrrM|nr:O-methyltransferase [Bacteroidales bacterium]